MDTKAYCERIKYHDSTEPTAENLRKLQLAHLQAVPFENLSIHYKQPINLNDDSLFEKIVSKRRGGFCYELNGLFGSWLRDLGYHVDRLSARVADADRVYGPDFDHMTLMVTLEQRWLVDVGFGDSFLEPLLIDERNEQVQGNRSYRIVDDNDHLTMLQREKNGDWRPQYRFTLQPYDYADYAKMCEYHQTSSQSPFTQKRVCTLATPTGRITLSNMRLITTSVGNERQERVLAGEAEYTATLNRLFGIETILD